MASKSPPRRSVFINPADDPPNATIAEVTQPQAVLEKLRLADPKVNRRPWDERHRFTQVSYRGFPNGLLEQLRQLASKMNVSLDDIARALLEYGIGAVWSGGLQLKPVEKGLRMTLFPQEERPRRKTSSGKASKAARRSAPRWQKVVTFRGIPPSLQGSIRELAKEQSVPVGELAATLIQHGLSAYQQGKLILQPLPKTERHSLFEE